MVTNVVPPSAYAPMDCPRFLGGSCVRGTSPSKQTWKPSSQAGEVTAMHGVSVSDHGRDKETWPGYWENRERKLRNQAVDSNLYKAVSGRINSRCQASPHATSSVCGPKESNEQKDQNSDYFKHCCLYFDGRVDGSDGLSNFSLGKLARLHGGEVACRLTKGGVTHVVCTRLSGSKELAALKGCASRNIVHLYFVRPEWITQSIASRRRLSETRFSLLAEVARAAGVSAKPVAQFLGCPKYHRAVADTESRQIERGRAKLPYHASSTGSNSTKGDNADIPNKAVCGTSGPESHRSRCHAKRPVHASPTCNYSAIGDKAEGPDKTACGTGADQTRSLVTTSVDSAVFVNTEAQIGEQQSPRIELETVCADDAEVVPVLSSPTSEPTELDSESDVCNEAPHKKMKVTPTV